MLSLLKKTGPLLVTSANLRGETPCKSADEAKERLPMLDGIVTGCILAIGRIVGESAALLFTAGMANNIMNFGQAFLPNNAGSTLTVALYMYAMEQGDFDTAFAIAAILLILTFIINFAAKQVARKLRKNTAAD